MTRLDTKKNTLLSKSDTFTMKDPRGRNETVISHATF